MAKIAKKYYLDEEVVAAIKRVAAEIHVSESAVVSLVMTQIDEWLTLPGRGAKGSQDQNGDVEENA